MTAALARAVAAYKDGQLGQAEEASRLATAENPADVEAWNLLGVILRTRRRVNEAIACYRKALSHDPRHAGAWTNLGNAARDLKQIETAITCHERAIALQPHVAEFHHNRGIALMAANRFDRAIEAYSRALLLKPDQPQMVWDRALAYLANGDFAQGWVDYTARFRTGELPKRDLPGKRWNGQPYSGQTLLIVAEQGFGDTIWVSRYLAHVKALGGTLIVESRPELARLLSMQNLADQIVERGKPLPAADFHVHQCSLPGLFTPDRASIPQSPYLKPHADADRFAEAKAAGGKRLRVGLVWSGSLTFKSNHERSIPLDRMIEAFSMPDVALYSLQVGAGAQQMKGKTPDQIYDLSPLLRDFADTAAGLDMLDLVIMTDSAVAHLGGALGRPVWVLLGYSPYWMWGCAGEKTDWYESLRLFRCAAWNDWSSVLDAAAAALTVHLNRGRDGNAEDS